MSAINKLVQKYLIRQMTSIALMPLRWKKYIILYSWDGFQDLVLQAFQIFRWPLQLEGLLVECQPSTSPSEQVWIGPGQGGTWAGGPHVVGFPKWTGLSRSLVVIWGPPCKQTDTHDWKHYLPGTTYAGGKNVKKCNVIKDWCLKRSTKNDKWCVWKTELLN